jgi:hypothetical protein
VCVCVGVCVCVCVCVALSLSRSSDCLPVRMNAKVDATRATKAAAVARKHGSRHAKDAVVGGEGILPKNIANRARTAVLGTQCE